MTKNKEPFLEKDKKLVYNILYTISNEDVYYKKLDYSCLNKAIVDLLITLDMVWITSDQRIKTTSVGDSTLKRLQMDFVDFEPKAIKFNIQNL